jgi:hypothetical protein
VAQAECWRSDKLKTALGRDPAETAVATLEAHAAWYIRRFGQCKAEWLMFAFGTRIPKDPTRLITSFKTASIKVRQKAGVKGRVLR